MKEFFERVRDIGGAARADIVEKDYHLHRLLQGLSTNEYFKDRFLFKGGTCRSKAFTGYFRFSEDADFTWADQGVWKDMTPSEARRVCSEEIYPLMENVGDIARQTGLRFSADKADTNSIRITSGGRIVTMFLRYESDVLRVPDFIKLEVNFIDLLLYAPMLRKLTSFGTEIANNELRFLYKEPFVAYSTTPELQCYDPREIFIEKCRASLTRRAFKIRDLIDIWYLQENLRFSIEEHAEDIVAKTRFMVDLYTRYRENLEITRILPADLTRIPEASLLLDKPPPGVHEALERITEELNRLKERLC